MLVGPGTLPPVKFDNADFVNVRCDVHPWMSCWIAVMDGPWFATTSTPARSRLKMFPLVRARWRSAGAPLDARRKRECHRRPNNGCNIQLQGGVKGF